jgi:hypothetical protein
MNNHLLYFLTQMHTHKHGFLYLCASFLSVVNDKG